MAELGENVAIQVSPVVDGMPAQRQPVSCHPDLLDIVPGMVLGDRPATQDRQAELGPDQLYHRLTDKPQFGYSIGAERMSDGIEIVRIARGISREDLLSQPSIHTVVNSNSPLIYDRATKIWKQLLADYEPPPLDPAIDEELEDFVARRVAEGGIPER